MDFLWDDFLGAVEKVINVLSDEELAGTYWITIKYKTRKNGKVIYRSRFAETDWSEKKEIKYLMYLKSQLIKETKKELKDLKQELNSLNAAKTLKKKK